jgi:hypothetical protein
MMNAPSTPNGVTAVLHSGSMSLEPTRIARLKHLMALRHLTGPTDLGAAIGKKTNQASDLLSGRASFGEKVARSIEAAAELPAGWLDVESDALLDWPFTQELRDAVTSLKADELARLENVMRAHLGLAPIHAPPALSAISTERSSSGHAVHEGRPPNWGDQAKK